MVSVQYAPVSPPGLGDIALGTPCAKTIQIETFTHKIGGDLQIRKDLCTRRTPTSAVNARVCQTPR